MCYLLEVNEEGFRAIEFARGRYAWADTLDNIVGNVEAYQMITNSRPLRVELSESEAWKLEEEIESDDGFLPCLDPESELYSSLVNLLQGIV